MKIDTKKWQKKIEEELKMVTEELESVGRQKPGNPKDWEAEPGDLDVSSADPNNAADRIEEYEDNSAILKQLEIRYNELKDALVRIDTGAYGVCEVSGEPIEEERLLANPAARTCVAHKDKKL